MQQPSSAPQKHTSLLGPVPAPLDQGPAPAPWPPRLLCLPLRAPPLPPKPPGSGASPLPTSLAPQGAPLSPCLSTHLYLQPRPVLVPLPDSGLHRRGHTAVFSAATLGGGLVVSPLFPHNCGPGVELGSPGWHCPTLGVGEEHLGPCSLSPCPVPSIRDWDHQNWGGAEVWQEADAHCPGAPGGRS